MKLTRPWRIALEILGPPPAGLAGLLLFGISAAIVEDGIERASLNVTAGDLRVIVGMLLISYVLAGVQSLVFAVIMEWRFSCGLNPGSWQSVLLSSAIGFASGGVLVPFAAQRPADIAGAVAFLGGVGVFAGFTIGFLIKLGARSEMAAAKAM